VRDAEQAGRPALACEVVPAALARAEALDGYDALETTRPAAEADPSALLTTWKGQWQVEHRHRDGKGPLRIRPLFVTSNRRIVGLVTILGIAPDGLQPARTGGPPHARGPPRRSPTCWPGTWPPGRPATTCSRRCARSAWSPSSSPGSTTAPPRT